MKYCRTKNIEPILIINTLRYKYITIYYTINSLLSFMFYYD